MRSWLLLCCSSMAVSACARETDEPANQVDVNAAAIRAESDIANYTGVPTANDDARLPDRVDATYRCADGSVLYVAFDNVADDARVRIGEAAPVTLKGMRPASGIWYAGGGYALRGKGSTATFTRPGGRDTACDAG